MRESAQSAAGRLPLLPVAPTAAGGVFKALEAALSQSLDRAAPLRLLSVAAAAGVAGEAAAAAAAMTTMPVVWGYASTFDALHSTPADQRLGGGQDGGGGGPDSADAAAAAAGSPNHSNHRCSWAKALSYSEVWARVRARERERDGERAVREPSDELSAAACPLSACSVSALSD